jgi:hypothetical protein
MSAVRAPSARKDTSRRVQPAGPAQAAPIAAKQMPKGPAFPSSLKGKGWFVAALLHVYLQDHLAGATFGYELAERCRRRNEGSEFGAPLAELAREIASDRQTLMAVMRRLGADRSNVKVSAAWLFEKARRLKPNGQLFSYTPLTRVVELESLAIGIAGKTALWRALESVTGEGLQLEGYDFAALTEQAEDQLRRVERLRLQAAGLAFSQESATSGPG